LLVEKKISSVFQEHDHFFAKHELDGIVYQLVSQRAQTQLRTTYAEEYGYSSGNFVAGSGQLRMTVSSQKAMVEFIRTEDRKVLYSYSIR